MDVDLLSRGKVALFFVVASVLFLIGCDKPKVEQAQELYQQDEECAPQQLAGEYIVQWKDGTVTKVHHPNTDELINKTILPHLENIERVNPNIQLLKLDNPPVAEKPDPNEPPKDKIPNKDEEGVVAYNNWGQESIKALYAWDNGYKGQGIAVAVIDSGVDISHELLFNRIAFNSGEIGLDAQGREKYNNGIDDDNNGYVDDYAGYNFASEVPLNNPFDSYSHGTHVSGIVSTDHSGDGIARGIPQGVAPEALIVPLDFIDQEAGGTLDAAIKAIDYVIANSKRFNIKVINASWGSSHCSSILESKIAGLATHDILFVTAAGNSGNNIDSVSYKEFPAAFNLPNQITVGSVSPSLNMSSFSNFGENSVDIFAPGFYIYSTIAGNLSASQDGTSMSSPFVAGAAAVLWSAKPLASFSEIKDALLKGSAQSALYLNRSKGRLDIQKSLDYLLGTNE